jgi:II/X family phage/plasmid replication protein
MHACARGCMFIDWLTVYQDHDLEAGQQLPLVSDRVYQNIDTESGEGGTIYQASFSHEGSFSTSIQIRVSGNRITASGNPSRYGRADNLFGFEGLDQCVEVYNRILRTLGLPEFTKCTRVWQTTDKVGGSSKFKTQTDGAVFQEIHITSNKSVGCGNQLDYLRGVSTLSYRNSVPNLHTNGRTVDWRSKSGNAGTLMYPSVYDKAHEMRLHVLPKLERKYGSESSQVSYVRKVIEFCESLGVVRFEQKIKGRLLQRMNAKYWGLFDQSVFSSLHEEFVSIDQRLQVESMSYESIAERLISNHVVDSTKAANTTASYALLWMHGQTFDLDSRSVQTHRARLRKIGIDIGTTCNLSRFSPVYVKKAKAVEVIDNIQAPEWYRHAAGVHLSLVA